MKKRLAFFLCFVMLLSLVACGEEKTQSTDPSTKVTQPTAASTGEPTSTPTGEPTTTPTGEPTTTPTGEPTTAPTGEPMTTPTEEPTTAPTEEPTTAPAEIPTTPTKCSHTYKAATCTAPKTCSKCGATEGKALGHSWKDATCTELKTCSRCGATEGSAKGHSWNGATCTAPKTCKTCGATEGSAAGHTEVIIPGKAPTAMNAGLSEGKKCSACGVVLVEQKVIPATGDLQGLKYEINADGKTCTVVGIGGCTDTKIVIPAKYNGYEVTAIGDRAFADCTGVTSIVLPDSIKSIGAQGFYGCTGLTEFTIPKNVQTFGTQIFDKASNLKTVYYNSNYSGGPRNVILNNGSIEKVIFGGTEVPKHVLRESSVKEVVLLDSVTSIGVIAFYECSSLTNITMSDSVTSIAQGAFKGCSSLTSITIPASITSIGASAFYNCSSLRDVYIEDLAAWCNINFSFEGRESNPLAVAENLYLNGQLVTDLVIPDGVTAIKGLAFYTYSRLTSVTIPDSVTTIDFYAFSGCSNLTSITIPNSVTNIGNGVFADCSGLTSVTIPSSVTSIDAAFANCSGLTSVTISDGVTSIGGAFQGCSNLTSITIPASVTLISNTAFINCSSLSDIKYEGTVEQWNAITFESSKYYRYYWYKDIPATEVVCLGDGKTVPIK